uniref:Uncharacterized protein n=1 Tax=Rhizophora mucronata TaxID=61149 RepID=A0A2P2PWI6_RHIMU
MNRQLCKFERNALRARQTTLPKYFEKERRESLYNSRKFKDSSTRTDYIKLKIQKERKRK